MSFYAAALHRTYFQPLRSALATGGKPGPSPLLAPLLCGFKLALSLAVTGIVLSLV